LFDLFQLIYFDKPTKVMKRSLTSGH